jgi:hypothetical protein
MKEFRVWRGYRVIDFRASRGDRFGGEWHYIKSTYPKWKCILNRKLAPILLNKQAHKKIKTQ